MSIAHLNGDHLAERRPYVSVSAKASLLDSLKGWCSRRETTLLVLLLALTLVRGMIYVAVIPPWQVPDEPYHFSSAWLPLLPPAPDTDTAWRTLQTEIASSMVRLRFWDYTVFEQAPQDLQEENARLKDIVATRRPAAPRAFTYYILALALRLVQHRDIVFQLYWARLCSVLVNLGIVVLAVWVGRIMFRGDPFGSWLLPLLIVFHPQHTFILAGVNDGVMAELFASTAVLAMIAIIFRGLHWTWFVLGTVCAALATAAKLPATFLVPVLALLIAVPVWQRLPTRWKWIGVTLGLAAIVGIVLGVPRVSGQIRIFQVYLNRVGLEAFLTSMINNSFHRGFLWAFRSWWAFLGWESLPASDGWVWSLLIMTGAAVLGWIRFIWHHMGNKSSTPEAIPLWRTFWVFILMLVVLGLLVTLKGATANKDMFVGRYFFVAILPITGLLVIGWREIVPRRWHWEALAAFGAFFFVFDTAILLVHALPFFYPLWR